MISVGVAACWSDLQEAERLVQCLNSDDIAARLICAGAAQGDDGACDVVVALWSPAAMTSLWVRQAVNKAAAESRLVEASLKPLPRQLGGGSTPVSLKPFKKGAACIAERIRRCAAGKPQTPTMIETLGPLAVATAVLAAAAAPFVWLATHEQDATATTDQDPTETIAEAPFPAPTPRDASPDPKPTGNGQGGPLIENAP
jgi:hypothetical protein